MAYSPTNWNTGDTITATKLNKLEQGVVNAGSNVYLTGTRSGDIVDMGMTISDAIAAMKLGQTITMYIPADGGIWQDSIFVLVSIVKNGNYYQPTTVSGGGYYQLMSGTLSDNVRFYLD